MLHTIREAQSVLVGATSSEVGETPSGESLGRFLARVAEAFAPRGGQTFARGPLRGPRRWRTRKDPFEGVWGDVPVRLPAESDATGKALMVRLQPEHPDRCTEAQRRTVQRRVKEWRDIMTKKPVYATTDPKGSGALRKVHSRETATTGPAPALTWVMTPAATATLMMWWRQ